MGGFMQIRNPAYALGSRIFVRKYRFGFQIQTVFLSGRYITNRSQENKNTNFESTPTASGPLGPKPTEVFYALSDQPFRKKNCWPGQMVPDT
jgi:hypothetical protein